MAGKHLRVFVACGTGPCFGRLLSVADELSRYPGVELFVQRGEGADRFTHLPGAALVSREAFAARLAWADVVVCHGGAGTLHEAISAGHEPLVMARRARFGEHVNDHQFELVRALEERGRLSSGSTSQELLAKLPAYARRKPRNPALATSSLTRQVALALVRDPAAHGLPGSAGGRLLRLTHGLLSRSRASCKALLVRSAGRRVMPTVANL